MIINIVTVMMIEEWAEIYYFEFHTYVSSTDGSETKSFAETAPVETSPQGIIKLHYNNQCCFGHKFKMWQ